MLFFHVVAQRMECSPATGADAVLGFAFNAFDGGGRFSLDSLALKFLCHRFTFAGGEFALLLLKLLFKTHILRFGVMLLMAVWTPKVSAGSFESAFLFA